jgi:hypothetical protein
LHGPVLSSHLPGSGKLPSEVVGVMRCFSRLRTSFRESTLTYVRLGGHQPVVRNWCIAEPQTIRLGSRSRCYSGWSLAYFGGGRLLGRRGNPMALTALEKRREFADRHFNWKDGPISCACEQNRPMFVTQHSPASFFGRLCRFRIQTFTCNVIPTKARCKCRLITRNKVRPVQ